MTDENSTHTGCQQADEKNNAAPAAQLPDHYDAIAQLTRPVGKLKARLQHQQQRPGRLLEHRVGRRV